MYMKKRSTQNQPGTVSPAPTSRPITVLDEIQRKLSNSAALNGGFDTLLYKIDKIEQSQGQLVNKVDKIHDAIYDPNEGIFSKLSEFKLENASKIGEISQDLVEINAWKKHLEKDGDKIDKTSEATSAKVLELEKHVETLVKSKHDMWALVKWVAVAVGGGIVTLFFAWLETKIK
jgi:chromosome segregation ATPase